MVSAVAASSSELEAFCCVVWLSWLTAELICAAPEDCSVEEAEKLMVCGEVALDELNTGPLKAEKLKLDHGGLFLEEGLVDVLADEEGARAAFGEPDQVAVIDNSALADQQRALRRQRGEAFGRAEIGDKALEVTVVDPDQA